MIKDFVIENPTDRSIKFKVLSDISKIDESDVEIAWRYFSEVNFDCSYYEHDAILLPPDSDLRQLFEYSHIDDEIEKWFIKNDPSNRQSQVFGNLVVDELDSYGLVQSPKQSSKTQQEEKNTAFIIMPIDPDKPELEDICNAYKEVCSKFGIEAHRADEIEHQENITGVILREIQRCEFLIADLSYERPNVYYEIGYAHAMVKRPILFRKKDTKVHFDLSVHNVPEYENITGLTKQLERRFEALTGRKAIS